jgi:hypothetical protein
MRSWIQLELVRVLPPLVRITRGDGPPPADATLKRAPIITTSGETTSGRTVVKARPRRLQLVRKVG